MRTRIKIHANKDTYYFIQVRRSVVFLSIQKSPATFWEGRVCVKFDLIVPFFSDHCSRKTQPLCLTKLGNSSFHIWISSLCQLFFFSLSLISNATDVRKKSCKVFHHKPFMLDSSLFSPLPSFPPSLPLFLSHPNTHVFMATWKNQMLRLAVRYFQNYPQMFDLG